MKLELKHLAPYLPYKLTVKDTRLTEGNQYRQLLPWLLTNDPKQEITIFIPILRPLSDLTIEIEHNGEKFVPFIEILRDSSFKVDSFDDVEYERWRKHFECPLKQNNLFIDSSMFCEIQLMISWHFDVFGLIPEGLAIDINTLES